MIEKVHDHLQVLWKAAMVEAAKALPQIIVGLVVFLVAWLLAIAVRYCIVRLANRSKKRLYLYRLIGSTVMMIIVTAGLVTALGTMGINVAALVTGIGLVGFAVSFALKDTLSNLMAGFLVLFYQPFRAGDFIKIGNVEGEVINITLRFTIVREGSQRTYIPNSMILNTPLTIKDVSPE